MARVRSGWLHHRVLNHGQKVISESRRSAVRYTLRGRAHETDHHCSQQERPGTISRHR